MPAVRRKPRSVTVKLTTITGNQLCEWRVYTMEMTQDDLAKWLGRTRNFVGSAEAFGDAEIPRSTYLECIGLAAELGKP